MASDRRSRPAEHFAYAFPHPPSQSPSRPPSTTPQPSTPFAPAAAAVRSELLHRSLSGTTLRTGRAPALHPAGAVSATLTSTPSQSAKTPSLAHAHSRIGTFGPSPAPMSLTGTLAARSPTKSPRMSSNHAQFPPSLPFAEPHALEPQHRRGLSWHNNRPPLSANMTQDPHAALLEGHDHEGTKSRHPLGTVQADFEAEQKDSTILTHTTANESEKMITPFLTKHVPEQYNPQPRNTENGNTKYCYRHRPDLKCRRQADEPSMEELQSELGTLSQSDQQAIAHTWALFSAAPAKLRNLMLQGILAQCCFPQLSFISTSVRNLIKIDFLAALPPELGFKILCYLDTTSLCKASQVSQKWRTLADDDVVWHKMCEQHIDRKCTKCGWGLPLLDQKRLRTEKRQIQLRATGRGLNEWSPNITPIPESQMTEVPDAEQAETSTFLTTSKKRSAEFAPHSPEVSAKRSCTNTLANDQQDSYFGLPMKRPWKDVYKDRFKVGTNWKYGRCTTKIFKGHANGVMCLQFNEKILVTGSYDATVKIWDIETGKEIRTLVGHEAGIRCLQFDDTRLLTGSIDKTVRVWNWRTGECIKVLRGHTMGVVCLHWEDNILASGSMDHKIRIWNFQNGHSFTLSGHTDWVNHVKIDAASRTLFSASDDCTVRLWDLNSQSHHCIKVFKGHVGQVQQVLLLPPEFEIDEVELSRNTEPDATSTSSASNTMDHEVPDADISLFPDEPNRAAPPPYMLTGSLDGTIRLWHISTGRCVHTFFGHIEGIWALAADSLRLVSGAEDKMVKIWDPRTGKHERTFYGHSAPVTCVGLSDSRLASGSEDCEVRMYSFTDEVESVEESVSSN